MPNLVAFCVLTCNKTFPESLRDCTNAKEVLSFKDLAAWITLPSVVLWQHIHTKYIQVPSRIGSEVIARASAEELRAYREFVRSQKSASITVLLLILPQLLPPRTQNHPVFKLDNALQWADAGHFWAFKTYGAQGFDTSGRCSYCEFYHAFRRLEKLEKKEVKRESRARRPGFFQRILSHVGTPTRTPSPRAQDILVAC